LPRFVRLAALSVALSVLLAGCPKSPHQEPGAPATPQSSPSQQAPLASASAAPAPSNAPPAGPSMQLPDFASLVEQYGPAVVNVSVVSKPTRQSMRGFPSDSEDDPFSDFFRRFGMPMQPSQPTPVRGMGSGFILSGDGYILTNAHVVADATQVTVKLTDRREFAAKVIGADTRTDVAVLKIEGKNLPTARLGEASSLRPGEWVLAIGSPFGFENSVTAGIVSATARSLPDENYVPFIQTDVPVNPGNSGGPLFNMKGEVVGINSQIYSRTGGYMGLSFAIPIEVARNVEEQLVKTGRVSRGRIGVAIQDVNAQLAESFGLDRPRGALISSVEKGGPADKAGLKAGDVILKVNGKIVEHSNELPTEISSIKPNTKVDLSIWRDRAERPFSVTVAELHEDQAKTARTGGSDDSSRLGIAVRPLTQAEQSQVDTEGKLVVTDVGGPAAEAGIQPGDVVLAVNGTKVATADQLRELVKKSSKTVALLIQRGDAQLFVPVPVG